jgi:hypothetical protein
MHLEMPYVSVHLLVETLPYSDDHLLELFGVHRL